jgi:hypothetical protein
VQEIEAYLLEVQHHQQQQQPYPSTHATTAALAAAKACAGHAVQEAAATTSNHAAPAAAATSAATQLPVLQVQGISAEQTHNVCRLFEGDDTAAADAGEVPSGAALAAALHAAWSYQDVMEVDCADDAAAAASASLQQAPAQQQQQHPEPWWQQQQQSRCSPMGIAASPGTPCAWETAPASGLVAGYGRGSSNAAYGEGAQLYSSLVVQQPQQQQKTPRGCSRLGAAGSVSASASASSALKKKKKGTAGSSHATPKVKTSTRSRAPNSRTTTAPPQPATPLAATAAPAGTVCAAAAAACAPGASAGRPQRKAAKLGIQKMQQAMRGQQQEDQWETWPEHTASRKLPKSRTASGNYERHSLQPQQLQPQPHIYLCQPLWVSSATVGSMQGQLGTVAAAGSGGAAATSMMRSQQGEPQPAGWDQAAGGNSQAATPLREGSAGSMLLLHLERCSTPAANNCVGIAEAAAAGLQSVCSSGSARSVYTALQLPASASPSPTAAAVAGLAAVDVAVGPAVQPAQRLWLWRQQHGTVAAGAGAAQDPAAVQSQSRLKLSLKGWQPVDRDTASGTAVVNASGRLLLLMKLLHSLVMRGNSMLRAHAPSRPGRSGNASCRQQALAVE